LANAKLNLSLLNQPNVTHSTQKYNYVKLNPKKL